MVMKWFLSSDLEDRIADLLLLVSFNRKTAEMEEETVLQEMGKCIL